uniref:Ribosome biogenesis protein NOP53 n=1 Tax=Plectus sambesii TaxID=2011161 RepID=A0A914VCM1_9BILA
YEKMAEEMSGLVKEEENPETAEETNEIANDAEDTYRPETAPISSENRKLTAARKRDLLQKKKVAAKKASKQQKKLLNDVFRVKTLQRQVEKETKRSDELAKRRARQKKLDKLTKPNRISKKKFEAAEEP